VTQIIFNKSLHGSQNSLLVQMVLFNLIHLHALKRFEMTKVKNETKYKTKSLILKE